MNFKFKGVKKGNMDVVNRFYKLPHEIFCDLVVNKINFICILHQHLGHLNVKYLFPLSQNI